MSKSSEDAVEKVLAGLREIEASAGMERRILAAVEERASAQPVSRWQWWSWRGLAWGGAFAVVAVVCVVVLIPASITKRHGQTGARVAPAKALLPAAVSAGVVEQVPPVLTKAAAASRERKVVRRAGLVDVAYSGSEAAMRVGNHPAPPMPLTEQERLLLRVVHRNRPQEIAMLNPAVRAKQEEEARVEFQMFFEPPLKKKTHEIGLP